MKGVIQELVKARLLVTDYDSGTGQENVLLAHEALIQGWDRLSTWIEEDRAALHVRRRIVSDAEEWERLDKAEEGLLRGGRLDEALAWAARHDSEVFQLVLDFLTASHALREREDQERKERQERELTLDRQMRELQERSLEAERRIRELEAERQKREMQERELEAERQRRHVFVSYIREDAPQVDRLCGALQEAGVKVWMDRADICPGERWRRVIRNKIQSGMLFVACFSQQYSRRDHSYMNEELMLAMDELRKRPTDRIWFIPVLLSECSVPERDIGGGETLRDIQWVDLEKDWEAGVQRILAAVSAAHGSAR